MRFMFINNLKIALNYHTYGDLLIYPWGYDYSLYTQIMEFVEMSRLLTRDNNLSMAESNCRIFNQRRFR